MYRLKEDAIDYILFIIREGTSKLYLNKNKRFFLIELKKIGVIINHHLHPLLHLPLPLLPVL